MVIGSRHEGMISSKNLERIPQYSRISFWESPRGSSYAVHPCNGSMRPPSVSKSRFQQKTKGFYCTTFIGIMTFMNNFLTYYICSGV